MDRGLPLALDGRPALRIRQGEIFVVDGSPWIVTDHFHNDIDKYPSLHCAPILGTSELRLDLDVPLIFENSFASLGLMRKLEKQALGPVVNLAHPDEVKQIRQNLVTWFSVFSFDFDTVRRLPDPPQDPGSIFPGMILDHTGDRVCVVDHWGCFNNYPLLYVAPVVRELDDPCPLDIDISADFRDLFSNNYFVRADDLFLAPRESLAAVSHGAVPMLRYGLLRRITRTMVLKFGQIGLLL